MEKALLVKVGICSSVSRFVSSSAVLREKSYPNIGNLPLIFFILVVVNDDTDTDDDQYCENETKRSHQITEDQRKIVSNHFWL